MNTRRILVPVDLVRSPSDALAYARSLAVDTPVSVTLLYVLNLNIVPPGGCHVLEDLCAEAENALRKLARLFFGTDRAVRIVIRIGSPHQEIAAQAKAGGDELIVMAAPQRRSWRRFFRLGTAQRIIDTAPCPVVVLPSRANSGKMKRPVAAEAEVPPSEALLPAA
jgi:nucleotide-binding universal stress UspA family protein